MDGRCGKGIRINKAELGLIKWFPQEEIQHIQRVFEILQIAPDNTLFNNEHSVNGSYKLYEARGY